MKNLKPIKTEADYETALAEIERLWGPSVLRWRSTRHLGDSCGAYRVNTIPWTP